MKAGALVIVSAIAQAIGCAADHAPEPLDVLVTAAQVQITGEHYQCLSELAVKVDALDRTQNFTVRASSVEVGFEALKVVELLKRLGFKSVRLAAASNQAQGWTLYPPVRPDVELTSCITKQS